MKRAALMVLFSLSACGSSPSGDKPDANMAAQIARDEANDTIASSGDAPSSTNASQHDKEQRALITEYSKPPADHSESASYQKEWYMVKGAVREKGYPCAAVSYVTEMADGTFKAICTVKRHSNKFDAFVIDPNAQTVVPATD